MITFKIKELLEKNKISRYKLEKYTRLSYERVNDYYFRSCKINKSRGIRRIV